MKGLSGEFLDIVTPLNTVTSRATLEQLRTEGFDSLAIVFLHSYTFRDHELAFAELARTVGFGQVSVSSSLVPMVRAVPRGHTACVDAYLTPKIKTYVAKFLSGFDAGLEHVKVSFMQSDGGLTPAAAFTGFQAILSGGCHSVLNPALSRGATVFQTLLWGWRGDITFWAQPWQGCHCLKNPAWGGHYVIARGTLCGPLV